MHQAKVFLFCLSIVVGVTWALDGFSRPEDLETTEFDIYPCYHDMHCRLGKQVYDDTVKCHKMLNDEDMEYLWRLLTEFGYEIFNGKTTDEMNKMMCPMDDDEKKELFDKVAADMQGDYVEECSKRADGERCAHLNELMGCFGDIIERLQMERKCGAGVDNSGKKN